METDRPCPSLPANGTSFSRYLRDWADPAPNDDDRVHCIRSGRLKGYRDPTADGYGLPHTAESPLRRVHSETGPVQMRERRLFYEAQDLF